MCKASIFSIYGETQAVSQEKENKGALDIRIIIKNIKCSGFPHKGMDARDDGCAEWSVQVEV